MLADITQLLLQQPNKTDCGINLLENTRQLSQKENSKQVKIKPNKLRVFYTKVLLAKTLYKNSEGRAIYVLKEKSFNPKNWNIVRRSKK